MSRPQPSCSPHSSESRAAVNVRIFNTLLRQCESDYLVSCHKFAPETSSRSGFKRVSLWLAPFLRQQELSAIRRACQQSLEMINHVPLLDSEDGTLVRCEGY